MKKIVLVLISILLTPSLVFAASFPDVGETHPQYAAIESLKNLQIVSGYPDGNFKPENPVQRVEALKMILLSAKIPTGDGVGDTGLSDIPGDAWFTKFVYHAKKEGIVSGNPDGTFMPAREVNKAEFAKMVLLAFKEDFSQFQAMDVAISSDVKKDDWFMPYMNYAKTIGIIHSSLDDLLEPGKALTRAQCADIIYKMLVIRRGGEIQKMLSITEAKLVDILVKLNNKQSEEAIQSANTAVYYSEKALELAPDKGIVKAANKIAIGFQKLCLAYKAGLEGNNDEARSLVAEAKDLAGQAYAADTSTQPLGKKIKEQGDVLLGQLKDEEGA